MAIRVTGRALMLVKVVACGVLLALVIVSVVLPITSSSMNSVCGVANASWSVGGFVFDVVVFAVVRLGGDRST